jgi:hypothetical protein
MAVNTINKIVRISAVVMCTARSGVGPSFDDRRRESRNVPGVRTRDVLNGRRPGTLIR